MLRIQTLVIHFTTTLQPQLRAIESRDSKLAEQLRRALLSVGLNLGEGYGASAGAKRRAYASLAAKPQSLRWDSRWRSRWGIAACSRGNRICSSESLAPCRNS